ncbi:PEP motif putative anchor domain protein [Gemmatirosa kalamazoonensis]|uniref:PEP motif putative anchor domain protein n=1 Tax=Gemmatirosa kalamazoonensis TaxID=861299 RepID=W0RD74_9BACT|nr:PEP-CTERM sorting domain-containing protein [Gemmatirosa kalamazoonensis]AHG89074.1 PEP motif putative anchor domain protein [Gemmatirosa kalamazoonensis]
MRLARSAAAVVAVVALAAPRPAAAQIRRIPPFTAYTQIYTGPDFIQNDPWTATTQAVESASLDIPGGCIPSGATCWTASTMSAAGYADMTTGLAGAVAAAEGPNGYARATVGYRVGVPFYNYAPTGSYSFATFMVDGFATGNTSGGLTVYLDSNGPTPMMFNLGLRVGQLMTVPLWCDPAFAAGPSVCVHTMDVSMGVSASGVGVTGQSIEDFSHTLHVGLQLAPGIEYISQPGGFLSDAPGMITRIVPTTTTPEPATLPLLGGGLAAFGGLTGLLRRGVRATKPADR